MALHTLEHPDLSQSEVSFPVPGSNRVERGFPKYSSPAGAIGQVFVNHQQYFDDVPEEAWEYTIGGIQVCEKWLKDRRGRLLELDDLSHYQRLVSALERTVEVVHLIDAMIDSAGGWPLESR